MREIDFRMYSGDKKGYFYDTRIVLECLINQNMGHVDYVKEGYAFEQFTGLLDKNGTKIFEGDKVKGKYYSGKIGVFNRIVGVVTFRNGCFEVSGLGKYEGLKEKLEYGYEVIGNIHEVNHETTL